MPYREMISDLRGEPCCANSNKVTDPQKVILSYKILYRILNSWSATLLTFHFPATVQHNFVNSPTPQRTCTNTNSPQLKKIINITTIRPIIYRRSTYFRKAAPSLFEKIPYGTLSITSL